MKQEDAMNETKMKCAAMFLCLPLAVANGAQADDTACEVVRVVESGDHGITYDEHHYAIAGGGGATFVGNWRWYAPRPVHSALVSTGGSDTGLVEYAPSYDQGGALCSDHPSRQCGDFGYVTTGLHPYETDIAWVEFCMEPPPPPPPEPIFADGFESGDSRWWSDVVQDPYLIDIVWVALEACGETPPERQERIVGGGIQRCSPSLWQIFYWREGETLALTAKLYTGGTKPQLGEMWVIDPLLNKGNIPFLIETSGGE